MIIATKLISGVELYLNGKKMGLIPNSAGDMTMSYISTSHSYMDFYKIRLSGGN